MCRRRCHRRGLTLIELCLVMAALTLTATVTTMLLHAMLRQQAASARQLAAFQNLTRLSDRYRKDVQAAFEAHLESADRLRLVLPDATQVTYSYEPQGFIRRTLQRDGQTSRDEFDLQGNCEISFGPRSYTGSGTPGIALQREPQALGSGDAEPEGEREPDEPEASARTGETGSSALRRGLVVFEVRPVPVVAAASDDKRVVPGDSSAHLPQATIVVAELGRDHRWSGPRDALEQRRQ